jgi:hypothetical protein
MIRKKRTDDYVLIIRLSSPSPTLLMSTPRCSYHRYSGPHPCQATAEVTIEIPTDEDDEGRFLYTGLPMCAKHGNAWAQQSPPLLMPNGDISWRFGRTLREERK